MQGVLDILDDLFDDQRTNDWDDLEEVWMAQLFVFVLVAQLCEAVYWSTVKPNLW